MEAHGASMDCLYADHPARARGRYRHSIIS